MFAIYGSSRNDGNSEELAEMILDMVPADRVYLREKNIRPIDDKRHDEEGFSHMNDDYYEIIENMLSHDTVLFVTPVYWYGMSGRMKNFVDRWSESMRDQELDFKEKIQKIKFYVVVVGGDDPHTKAMPLIQQFQYIIDFVKGTYSGSIIGEANAPRDIQRDSKAIAQAREWNQLFKQ